MVNMKYMYMYMYMLRNMKYEISGILSHRIASRRTAAWLGLALEYLGRTVH